MYIKFLIFSIISFNAIADQISSSSYNVTISSDKNSGGEILLKANNCKILEDQARAIQTWSIRINEKYNPELKCICKSSRCVMNISKISPIIVKQLHGVRPKFMGPNCWNSSLVSSKILPYPRYSTPEEMYFWMNSPLCTERNNNESPVPGDVIAIRANNEEYHGFIYLTDEISFSKNGSYNGNPYAVMPTKYVFDAYGVDKNCQRTQEGDEYYIKKVIRRRAGGKVPIRKEITEKCDKSAQIFSCKSWADYSKSLVLSPLEKQTLKELNQLSCQVSNKLFKDDYLIDKDFVNHNLDIILNLANSNVKSF